MLAFKRHRMFTTIARHPVALLALAVTLVSLTACAGTGNTSFLGPAFDGPTAAYGYNQP
jgi:hypothetical protein